MTESSHSITVAVVDAETPGNVGTIARAMKNFGLSELLLVDPPELDPDGEAYGFAGRAREDVLPNATELTFDDLVEGYHTIGCTAITNEDPTKHVRYPALEADELVDHLGGVDADVSAEYPSLNLGQAATIVLYELRELTLAGTQHPEELHERAGEAEIDRLYDQFDDLLVAIGHPEPKRAKANRLLRRLLGRAHPTPREVSTLRGILRRATELSEPPDERPD
ncbi:RNA methyltransferase [Halobacteriales archaeon QH_2_66_30]|nr:MAG: RNA methyltransferase [Halobacteriales archaeon QH_2_66_30]